MYGLFLVLMTIAVGEPCKASLVADLGLDPQRRVGLFRFSGERFKPFVSIGGVVYFAGRDPEHGVEP